MGAVLTIAPTVTALVHYVPAGDSIEMKPVDAQGERLVAVVFDDLREYQAIYEALSATHARLAPPGVSSDSEMVHNVEEEDDPAREFRRGPPEPAARAWLGLSPCEPLTPVSDVLSDLLGAEDTRDGHWDDVEARLHLKYSAEQKNILRRVKGPVCVFVHGGRCREDKCDRRDH